MDIFHFRGKIFHGKNACVIRPGCRENAEKTKNFSDAGSNAGTFSSVYINVNTMYTRKENPL
jgi:hypothetical protein